MQIRVHIASEFFFMNEDVFVDIETLAVPRIGETLYLTTDQLKTLEDKAKIDTEIASGYAPKWFYGKSYNCKNPKKENLKDLNFSDAIYVSNVLHNIRRNKIEIELSDESPERFIKTD